MVLSVGDLNVFGLFLNHALNHRYEVTQGTNPTLDQIATKTTHNNNSPVDPRAQLFSDEAHHESYINVIVSICTHACEGIARKYYRNASNQRCTTATCPSLNPGCLQMLGCNSFHCC
eukprot:2678556-Amphidinium_carterae.1